VNKAEESFGKIGWLLVILFIVVVLAVLLITRTITPPAGLPILAFISAFAFGLS